METRWCYQIKCISGLKERNWRLLIVDELSKYFEEEQKEYLRKLVAQNLITSWSCEYSEFFSRFF